MAKRNGANGLDVMIEMLQRVAAAGLHTSHLLVALEALRLQKKGQKPRFHAISDRLGIPYSSVSRVAYELIEKGFADFEAVDGDRRSKYFVITNSKRLEKIVGL